MDDTTIGIIQSLRCSPIGWRGVTLRVSKGKEEKCEDWLNVCSTNDKGTYGERLFFAAIVS